MTKTIAYDRHVKNLIDELSATKHVTHKSYKKKSVTLHHNAGRLSHEGVLNVWRTRPASAHFDVDSKGKVAQYVNVYEYAWGVGSTKGNCETISIEQCNSTLGPLWEIAEVTWKAACRLAGWLFANVIGERPTAENFFVHHHWKPTACAGPYMDKIYKKALAATQLYYIRFKKAQSPVEKPKPRPKRKTNEQVAKEVLAGKWGSGTIRKNRLSSAGYNYNAIQKIVNRLVSSR